MKIKSNIAVSETGFIFNPDSGESFNVNLVGGLIIKGLKESKPYEEIKEDILNEYHIDETTLEKDYFDFIGLLRNFGLVEDEEE